MILNRFVKWAATGVLALGVIPAVGMARSSHASLPTSGITVTPTSMAKPAAKPASRVTHVTAAKAHTVSHKRHLVKHHRKASSKQTKTTAASKHGKTSASHKRVVSHRAKTAGRHTVHTSALKAHKAGAKTSAHA
jgi:hypothetical protein